MFLNQCPRCSKHLEKASNFCPYCGYKLSNANNLLHKRISAQSISKLIIVFCMCIGLIILSVTLLTRNDNEHSVGNVQRKQYEQYSHAQNSTINASTIFNNLKMSNFSASLGQHGGKMSCTVLNNNSFTVSGYFYVSFYDKRGTLLYSQLMPLPSVGSGEQVVCSTLIPKSDYPSEYSYVKYSQASLVKD